MNLELKCIGKIDGPWIGDAYHSHPTIGIRFDRDVAALSYKVADVQSDAPVNLIVHKSLPVAEPQNKPSSK
jgi:hypothetical protein